MIITIVLFAIILFLIYDITMDILYGKSYLVNRTLLFSEFQFFLELLKDANVNAILSIVYPKAQLKFEIIKRQNEKEWWFELHVKKRKRKLFDIFYPKHFPNEVLESRRKVIYKLGYDVKKIYSFLEEVFIKNLGLDKNSKISANFNNTRVLHNLKYYQNKYSSTKV